jgi:copper chaperone
MRKIVALMSILSVLGFSTAASAQSTGKPQASQTSTLKVSGMACGACAASVEGVVRKVDGVLAAVVSQPKGTAEITFDPAKTSPHALAKAINEKTPFKAELMISHPKQ